MPVTLTPIEARIIGALLEKEITTPDQYPLSVNALVVACNQKSNRDPVMSLDEATVQEALDALVKRGLVSGKAGFGSRVAKYQHRFCNTQFGSLSLSTKETAVICELLLRGPQTPGELRSRAGRLASFGDVAEVETTLSALMDREDGPFVRPLPRQSGKRESRYAQLFSESAEAATETLASGLATDEERLSRLEKQVSELHQVVAELRKRLDS